MENFTDKLADFLMITVFALIASFLVVAMISSFVDTGLFQVDHTLQTIEVFSKIH